MVSSPSPEAERRARFRAAARTATGFPFSEPPSTPAERLSELAAASASLGIDDWDRYGEGGAIDLLEAEVAGLLGKGSAAYFPSGVMAQQAALRVWCDRAATRRVAMPDLSHLLLHEEDGPRRLHRFEIELLTTGPQVATAGHLATVPGRLAAALIELPLREAGGLLPTWEELNNFARACAARDIRVHVDGARLWEAAAGLGRSPGEVAEVGDTVYVSFYKILGGLVGAALAGPDDVIEEAKLWRRRMGGTLYGSTPAAVSAIVGLRNRLEVVPELIDWARAFVAALPDSVAVEPSPPHTNMFHAYATGDADRVNDRLLALIERTGIVCSSPWNPTDDPQRLRTEFAVVPSARDLDPAVVAALVGELFLD